MHTRNVTLTLNLTDSQNVTDSRLALNLSRVLHTIQVGVGLETGACLSAGRVQPTLAVEFQMQQLFLMTCPTRVFSAQETVEETVPVSGSSEGVNALGLVVFSMCFGLVIGSMKEQGQALRDFFDCLNEAIMRLVAIIIWSVTSSVKWTEFDI